MELCQPSGVASCSWGAHEQSVRNTSHICQCHFVRAGVSPISRTSGGGERARRPPWRLSRFFQAEPRVVELQAEREFSWKSRRSSAEESRVILPNLDSQVDLDLGMNEVSSSDFSDDVLVADSEILRGHDLKSARGNGLEIELDAHFEVDDPRHPLSSSSYNRVRSSSTLSGGPKVIMANLENQVDLEMSIQNETARGLSQEAIALNLETLGSEEGRSGDVCISENELRGLGAVSSSQEQLCLQTPALCDSVRISRGNSRLLCSDPLVVVPTLESQVHHEFSIEGDRAPELSQRMVVTDMDSVSSEESVSELEKTSQADRDADLDVEVGAEDEWLAEFQKHIPSELDRVRETWSQVSDYSGLPRHTSRRRVLGAPMFMSLLLAFGWSTPGRNSAHAAVLPAKIDLTKVPVSSQFDVSDLRLRNAASITQQALQASTLEEEENLWTDVIDLCNRSDAEWVPDILARALGNRGNARSRQGRLELALGDYNQSIELAPYAVDPVLNRGVALESLGRLDEACADYEAVLQVQPDDPAAWNNLGNVKAALRQWDAALLNYFRAVQLAPRFAFAAANYALVLYQVGRDNEAVRQFRNLLRKYPEFSDVRAALAVSLYEQGFLGEAETNWGRLDDGRYKDRDWVWNTRRWPPRLASALEDFLDVKGSST